MLDKDKLLKLIELEGDYFEDKYLDIKYFIRRVDWGKHLCGYIELPTSIIWTNELEDIIDRKFHGGITYHEGNVVGFDCAHYNDLIPSQLFNPLLYTINNDTTYKDMKFVKICLITTIKHIVDYQNKIDIKN